MKALAPGCVLKNGVNEFPSTGLITPEEQVGGARKPRELKRGGLTMVRPYYLSFWPNNGTPILSFFSYAFGPIAISTCPYHPTTMPLPSHCYHVIMRKGSYNTEWTIKETISSENHDPLNIPSCLLASHPILSFGLLPCSWFSARTPRSRLILKVNLWH